MHLLMHLLKRFTNSPRALVGSYLLLIVVSGTLYWYFESDKTIGDSVWWAVVTASTVGYGDTYPLTWQGRVLAGFLISLMVLFVIPLITAHFASKLIVDNDAFQHEEQEEIKTQLRQIRMLVEGLDRSIRGGSSSGDGSSLSRDGRDGLLAELGEIEARVGKDLRGKSVALPQEPEK